ncbi:MAG: hypothetical protein KGZ65_01800 [Sphingomonadales bacterium]|nr:hypothetical protein [Sphingomonadaceae bacterium]MBS3929939.1 hypothetical protein [Sphingomonadales bacterium]
MTDLFGNGQFSLFGEGEDRIPHPAPQDYVPDIPRIRGRLLAVLETARAAPATPWPEKKMRMWQTVFPNMSKWLPDDERDQLCFEFAAEIERLSKAA